jgi:hypothetical protein
MESLDKKDRLERNKAFADGGSVTTRKATPKDECRHHPKEAVADKGYYDAPSGRRWRGCDIKPYFPRWCRAASRPKPVSVTPEAPPPQCVVARSAKRFASCWQLRLGLQMDTYQRDGYRCGELLSFSGIKAYLCIYISVFCSQYIACTRYVACTRYIRYPSNCPKPSIAVKGQHPIAV